MVTKPDPRADAGVAKDAKAKDFTSSLPMIDLEEAIKLVTSIYEKALETANMDDVAQSLGFANATSTGFYRRVSAARMFGLLSAKATLAQRATDYIKPHDEGLKEAVLVDAIMGISPYADLVNRHFGKKLNIGLLANWIAKEFHLTDACAGTCARVFEASLRFAGMLSEDGSVHSVIATTSPPSPPQKDQPLPKGKVENEVPESLPEGTEQHILSLDKENKDRKFIFTGPIAITQAEYDRICQWLKFTMIIEDSKGGAT